MPSLSLNENRIQLYSLYQFRAGSKLRPYLISKWPSCPEPITLIAILEKLKKILSSSASYDTTNPAIIVCNSELEEVLNCKALHILQLRQKLIAEHIVVLPSDEQPVLPALEVFQTTCLPSSSTGSQMDPHVFIKKVSTVSSTDTTALWTMEPDLRDAIALLETFPIEREIFTFAEILGYIADYLREYESELVDPGNVHIVMGPENDPLLHALKVTSFHRCQIQRLLCNSLVYESNSSVNVATTSKSTKEPSEVMLRITPL